MEHHSDPQPIPEPQAVIFPPRGTPPVRPRYFDTAPPPPVAEANEQGSTVLLEYWNMLRRRRGTLLLLCCLGGLAAILYTLPQTPIYQARATLEIQGLNENFMNMGSVNPTTTGNSYYPELDIQTQIRIIQSRSLIERTLAKFEGENRAALAPKPDRISAWRKVLRLKQSEPAAEGEAALGMAAGALRVRALGATRIIEASSDSTNPAVAARFLNTLANEFIEQNLEARWQTTERTGEFLGRQLADMKIKLEQSDSALQAYAAQTGLVFTSEKDNVAEERLKQLQEELSTAQGERITKQSRYEMAASSPPEALPDVLDDSSLRGYQTSLTDLRRQVAQLTSSLTPAHPKVRQVQAQISTIEAALEKERGNIIKRIRNDFETAQRRENLLAKDYAAQSKSFTQQASRTSHYNILKREVDTNRQLYDTMLQKVKEAGVVSALRASNIRVVDQATPPSSPYKPNVYRSAILGLVMGLFGGIALVLVTERVDRSIQTPGDAALYLGVPELGIIPSTDAARSERFAYYTESREIEGPEGEKKEDSGKRGAKGGVELIMTRRRPSVLAEGFRATLASILFLGENGDRPRVLVLTSPNPREGKTTVASNLALAAAEINRRVLLIDADLRKPRLHNIFQLPNEWGLSDLLLGKKPPEGHAGMPLSTGHQQLYVIPAGSVQNSIASLLHSPRMAELLQSARKEYDMIFIDTPPMLHIPDARVLARLADGVIMVVRSTTTTRDTAIAAGQRFREDGTRMIGTILNQWNPKKTGGYGYSYDYKYYRYY